MIRVSDKLFFDQKVLLIKLQQFPATKRAFPHNPDKDQHGIFTNGRSSILSEKKSSEWFFNGSTTSASVESSDNLLPMKRIVEP